MEADALAVVQVVVAAAKAGDIVAAKIILDRIVPIRRGRPVKFRFPSTDTPAGLVGALSAVISAVADGALTPEEGLTIASLIEVQRNAIETVDFDRRLRAIEDRY